MLSGTVIDPNSILKNSTITISKSSCFSIFLIENKILIENYSFLKCQKIFKKYFRYTKKIFVNDILKYL